MTTGSTRSGRWLEAKELSSNRMELDGEMRFCTAVMELAVKHLKAPYPTQRYIEMKSGSSRPITAPELDDERRAFRQSYLSAARFFLEPESSSFEWMTCAVKIDANAIREGVARIIVARYESDPSCFDFAIQVVGLAKERLHSEVNGA